MKKAAVITVSIILFVALLGVNYLLWDNAAKKENIQELESEDTSQKANLEKVIEDLYAERDKNIDLRMQLSDMTNQFNIAKKEIEQLKVDIQNVYTIIGDKNTIIYELKKNIDQEVYKKIVEEWVDDINNKDYFNAYRSHNEQDIFKNREDILYTRYGEKFINIEYMEVTDFKVRVLDNVDALDQKAKNRIVFDALFNIEMVKDEKGFPVMDNLFNEGANHFKVTMDFDQDRWKWYIYTIGK